MTLNEYIKDIAASNIIWWTDPLTGLPIYRNVGEMLALQHSEISEGLEGHRKNLMDTHLPQYKMLWVECADLFIRMCDLIGHAKEIGYEPVDFDQIVADKREYNANRADHKIEARMAINGKKY